MGDDSYDRTWEKGTARAGFSLGVGIGERIGEAIVEHSAQRSRSPQEATVKEIFKAVIGPLSSLERGFFWNQMSTATTTEFFDAFHGARDSMLEAKSAIDELAPDIASNLFELVNLLDKGTNGTWDDLAFRDFCSNNQSVLPLVSSLTRLIASWLSAHD